MLTCPCNVHPLTPHFYIVKLGFTGVYIIFLFLLLVEDSGCSLEQLACIRGLVFGAEIGQFHNLSAKYSRFCSSEKLLYIAWACFRHSIMNSCLFLYFFRSTAVYPQLKDSHEIWKKASAPLYKNKTKNTQKTQKSVRKLRSQPTKMNSFRSGPS